MRLHPIHIQWQNGGFIHDLNWKMSERNQAQGGVDDVQLVIEEHHRQQRNHPPPLHASLSRHHRKSNPSITDVVLAELDDDDKDAATLSGKEDQHRASASHASESSWLGKLPAEETIERVNGSDHPPPPPGISEGSIHEDSAPAVSTTSYTGFSLDRQLRPVAQVNKKTVKRHRKAKTDRYFDYFETHKQVLGLQGLATGPPSRTAHKKQNLGEGLNRIDSVEMEIPSLAECQAALHNEEAAAHREANARNVHVAKNVVLDFLAALYVYITNTLNMETLLVLLNAASATIYFLLNHERFAVKLDFSFLAFSVVFPLTFLIQSTFNRREVALQRIVDFKSAVLSAALLTFTVDWESEDSKIGGRLALPPNFGAAVATDFRDMIQLVFEYLSMPSVSHGKLNR